MNRPHGPGLPAAIALAFAAGLMTAPAAHAQFGFGVGVHVDLFASAPPPPLPVYEQPPIPADGYIWTPGYWAFDTDFNDYYWVPGTWVEPPQPGLLWTPGYWGYTDGRYGFIGGYWGPQVGFYGGINYGFGYTGDGYAGGRWRNNHFYYNSTVNNVRNVDVTNVYVQQVNAPAARASFNGPGGAAARPTPGQVAFARAPHTAPTPNQVQHVNTARQEPSLRASNNGGRPAIAATARPAAFHGPGVVPAARAGGPAAGGQRPPGPAGAPYATAPQNGRRDGGQPPYGQAEGRPGGQPAPNAAPARGPQAEHPAAQRAAPPPAARPAAPPRPEHANPPPARHDDDKHPPQ